MPPSLYGSKRPQPENYHSARCLQISRQYRIVIVVASVHSIFFGCPILSLAAASDFLARSLTAAILFSISVLPIFFQRNVIPLLSLSLASLRYFSLSFSLSLSRYSFCFCAFVLPILKNNYGLISENIEKIEIEKISWLHLKFHSM